MAFLYKLKQNFQKIGGVVIAKFFLQMGSFWADFGVFDLVVLGKIFHIKRRALKIPLSYYVLRPTQMQILVLPMPGLWANFHFLSGPFWVDFWLGLCHIWLRTTVLASKKEVVRKKRKYFYGIFVQIKTKFSKNWGRRNAEIFFTHGLLLGQFWGF